ncbi:MAG: RecX family transcriptional regulator [Phycisphaeraceae bacterium]|nr:RecX family transcriptional regulator [Phycisphaeraceae bacterium]MBX3368477.1 RecX family transcriptional regulator [Phycisphaeraceae bacterium]
MSRSDYAPDKERMDEDERQREQNGEDALFPTSSGSSSASNSVIVSVRELTGTPKRVSVLVGGRRRVATLLATQAMELALAPGVPWTDELATLAARMERVNAAKSMAMRRLASRARSRAEMLQWLTSKGTDPQVATEAIERLAEIGLISDTQVVEDERRRAVAKGLSARALADRMASRGIGTHTDSEDPPPRGSDHGDAARALEVARSELSRRAIDPADVNVLARRVMGVLARKGYEQDLAKEAVVAALRERGLRLDQAFDD